MKTSISIKTKEPNIELNEQFKKAIDLLENSLSNIFITGKAGTGKSTLLNYWRGITAKKTAVLAPTGVAALNVRGQTIHSFFRFKPDIILKNVKKLPDKKGKDNLYTKIDAIIIDEISMVRADLLDCVDKFLRLNGRDKDKPFGGIQMVFIGDLYQLSPVVSSREKAAFKSEYNSHYFFDAKVFAGLEMEFVELEKIYRQQDPLFIKLLNSIRNNSVNEEELERLNERVCPDFKEDDSFYIYLTTTNKMAEELNDLKLDRLKNELFSFSGELMGNFDYKYLPTRIELSLKNCAQVMFLNNDSLGRWVNGTIGKVVDIDINSTAMGDPGERLTANTVSVELADGKLVEVIPYTWEIFNFYYDENGKTLETKTVGSFTQFPLKLAWAVTIHKSQGKTFNKVIIDIGNGTFAHGQVYVALSRCTSLEGLVLKRPIAGKHILMDYKVTNFLTEYQYRLAEKACPTSDKIKIIEAAIADRRPLNVVYLKNNDTKSNRVIQPVIIGEMEYRGKTFLGLKAFCRSRGETRIFRLDRILEIKEGHYPQFD